MSDKENVSYGSQSRKPATRIPVPKKPLPLLPNHLITTAKERGPLITLITSNNVASTSNSIPPAQKKKEKTKVASKNISIKCDLTHITLRNKNEVDWTHNVFHDSDDSIVHEMVIQNNVLAGPSKGNNVNLNKTLSPDSVHNKAFLIKDEDEEVELIIKAGIKTESALGQTDSATRPVPIINKAIKNVKKSLKRPHSRELQGIPTSQQARQEEGEVKRRPLSYLEDTVRTPDYWKRAYITKDQDYALDILGYLLKTESKAQYTPNVPKELRILVVNWLIKINGAKGNPAVIQTACWFFDTVLCRSTVATIKIQQLAAACFWIAQKFHGSKNPFAASKLTASAQNFSVEKLLNTERQVLIFLQFPTQPILALDFIPYLSWWCDGSHPGDIEVAAIFICMCGVLIRRSLCQQYPSVVAAAAVLTALRLLKKTHLIPRLETSSVYKAASNKEKQTYCTPISKVLCRAVISASALTDRTLVEHYNFPPHYIARKIIAAAAQLPDLVS